MICAYEIVHIFLNDFSIVLHHCFHPSIYGSIVHRYHIHELFIYTWDRHPNLRSSGKQSLARCRVCLGDLSPLALEAHSGKPSTSSLESPITSQRLQRRNGFLAPSSWLSCWSSWPRPWNLQEIGPEVGQGMLWQLLSEGVRHQDDVNQHIHFLWDLG